MASETKAPPDAEHVDTSVCETGYVYRWSYRHPKTGKVVRAKDRPFRIPIGPRRRAHAPEQLRLFPEPPPHPPAKVRTPKQARGR